MTNHPRDMVHVVTFCPEHEVEMCRDDEGGSILEWCPVCSELDAELRKEDNQR
jgi:hypothetical protein